MTWWAEYASSMWKATGADEIAIEIRRRQKEVWVYRFDWDEEPRVAGADISTMIGAGHAVEIDFVSPGMQLGGLSTFLVDKKNGAGRVALSQVMTSYWTQFAYRGDPGKGRRGEQPHWRAWDPPGSASPRFIVLDTPQDGGVRMESGYQTTARVVARVLADERFEDGERCERLSKLLVENPRFGPAEYAATNCAELAAAEGH